jgi:hypothetical protein
LLLQTVASYQLGQISLSMSRLLLHEEISP